MALKWLEQHQVQGMLIRVLPLSTADFRNFMEKIFSQNFVQEEYRKLSQRDYEQILLAYQYNLQQYQLKGDSGVVKLFNVPPLPNYAVFAVDNPATNYLNEFFSCSIPVFYAYANGSRLYNSLGQEIKVHFEDKLQSFFPLTPINFIMNRIKCIIDEENSRDELVNRAQNDYERNIENFVPYNIDERLVAVNLVQAEPLIPIISKEAGSEISAEDSSQRKGKDRGCTGCILS